jgi:hypothetical protein
LIATLPLVLLEELHASKQIPAIRKVKARITFFIRVEIKVNVLWGDDPKDLGMHGKLGRIMFGSGYDAVKMLLSISRTTLG